MPALTDASSNEPSRTSLAGRLAALRVRPGLVVMVLLTTMASAVNYASSVVFSRVLPTASFGDLTALLSLAVVLSVPCNAAQTVVAARIARFHADGEDSRIRFIMRYALGHVVAVGAAVTVVYLLLVPLTVIVLDLQAWGAAVALTPVVFLAFPVPIVLGLLQGLDRYVAFGVMMLAVALSRLLFGIPWAEAGGGAGGALAGQGVGMILVLFGGMWALRAYWRREGTGAGKAGLKRKVDLSTVSATGAFIAFAVISNLDIVLAKVFLEPHDAGLYAALATVAKIIIFLPSAIAVVLVPNAARARGSLRAQRRALRTAALGVLATAVLVAVPIAAAPRLTLELMFGKSYTEAASGVLPIVIAGLALGLLSLLVVYSVTIEDRRWVLLLLLGVGVQVIGISLFHSSPTEVAVVQMCAVFSVLAVNEVRAHSLLRLPSIAREHGG